ncbi:MAG: hypothetical protein ACKVX9_20285 [Blastocatellia bacterium]
MIHNVFFSLSQGPKQIGFAPPVIILPAALVLASFRTLAVSEASAAELSEAGFETAGEAAISLSPVAVRADKEEATAVAIITKPLTEKLFRMR